MNFGISTACFYPEVLTEDTLKIISSIGFKLCEVFFESATEMTGEILLKIDENIKKYNLSINTVHPFPAFFEPFLFDVYARRREEMEEKFELACRAAKKLGAKYYIFHGQRNNKQIKDIKWTAEVMDNLCKIALKYDVYIAWENVSWCMGNDPKFIQAVKENMKEELYFTLDVKQAIRSGRNIDEYLNVYENRIVNVHISDSNEFCDCLLPGYGGFDFKEVINKTQNLNKDCQYIIEVYRDNYGGFDEIKKSFEYMKNLEV